MRLEVGRGAIGNTHPERNMISPRPQKLSQRKKRWWTTRRGYTHHNSSFGSGGWTGRDEVVVVFGFWGGPRILNSSLFLSFSMVLKILPEGELVAISIRLSKGTGTDCLAQIYTWRGKW